MVRVSVSKSLFVQYLEKNEKILQITDQPFYWVKIELTSKLVLIIDHFTVPCAILKGSQAFASKRGWS
jgi:hypothetical protein